MENEKTNLLYQDSIEKVKHKQLMEKSKLKFDYEQKQLGAKDEQDKKDALTLEENKPPKIS